MIILQKKKKKKKKKKSGSFNYHNCNISIKNDLILFVVNDWNFNDVVYMIPLNVQLYILLIKIQCQGCNNRGWGS